LDSVPRRNEAATCTKEGDGAVLQVPIRRRWWMRAPLGWLFPFRDHRNFGLDAFGLEIWEACDGGRTVEAICEGFAERHQVSFEEARGAINQFLHILLLKDLIFIEVPATPEELS